MSKITYSRDKETGLIQNQDYKYLSNGKIDWKSMINPKYVVFNSSSKLEKELIERYGATSDKLVYSDVIKEKVVDERHILILLMGFIELAELRGYIAAPVNIVHVLAGQNVTAQCHITWIANSEEPFNKISSGEADATFENTNGWGYLAAVAGNRAFVRAVKRGLGISILGADEISKKDSESPDLSGVISSSVDPLSPQGILQKTANDLKISFELVKKGAITKYREKMVSKPEEWAKFEDILPKDCMTLIDLLRKGKE